MPTMSLEELKRANAAEEQQKPVESKAEAVEKVETETPEIEAKAEGDEAESEGTESDGDESSEAWMSTKGERKFTDSDIGAAKHKLRAKLERQHQADTAALRAENERLKQQLTAGTQSKTLRPVPTEADAGFDPKKHAEMMRDWVAEVAVENGQRTTQQQKIAEAKAQLSKAEDEHYSRAEKLVTQHGINPDVYRDADDKVRSTLERIRPGEGEIIAAQLINVIGEGSEKLFYWLGRNPDALAVMESHLVRDPSGVQAVAYLSRKAAELSLPAKKTTNAPKPPTQIGGDGSSMPARIKALKEAHARAHSKGDVQAAWELRRQARAAGVDTSKW